MGNYQWHTVPDGIKTKTTWSNEGRRVLKGETPQIHRIYTGGRWKQFEFYTWDQTVEKRKVVRKEKESLDFSVENLAVALYLINKSAKVSRDTKQASYEQGNYTQVRSSKTRQTHLYQLKDDVLTKALNENLAIIKGYHLASGSGQPLALVQLGDLTFHRPINQTTGLTELGELEMISKEVNPSIKGAITFMQAKNLLKAYLTQSTL